MSVYDDITKIVQTAGEIEKREHGKKSAEDARTIKDIAMAIRKKLI